MKKSVLLFVVLLFVVCGCGATHTIKEQQTEFRAWFHEYQQKSLAVNVLLRKEKQVLKSLEGKTITPADADTQFKQLNQQIDQAVQAFAYPPEIKTLSKDDQELLKDAYKNRGLAASSAKKLSNDHLNALKSSNSTLKPQMSYDTKKPMPDTMKKADEDISKVAKKLDLVYKPPVTNK